MKEKIYTIPLTEAYETDCECPFCHIEEEIEGRAVEYAVGASMMEPDSRIISNEKGFCGRHYRAMQEESKALSFALILDTHLNEIISRIKVCSNSSVPKKKLFRKSIKDKSITEFLSTLESSCVVCDKINDTMFKFAEVFWYLYKNEKEFKSKVLNSKGFCLPHFRLLLENVCSEIKGAEAKKCTDELIELELKNLERLNSEVNWFTKKFDYRFTDEPWNNAEDAPKRAVIKLSKF